MKNFIQLCVAGVIGVAVAMLWLKTGGVQASSSVDGPSCKELYSSEAEQATCDQRRIKHPLAFIGVRPNCLSSLIPEMYVDVFACLIERITYEAWEFARTGDPIFILPADKGTKFEGTTIRLQLRPSDSLSMRGVDQPAATDAVDPQASCRKAWEQGRACVALGSGLAPYGLRLEEKLSSH